MAELKISEIKRILDEADCESFPSIERSLLCDGRKGVQSALESTRKRLEKIAAEKARQDSMYDFERELLDKHGAHLAVGLDEVGRGPVAGPLSVGAVVLDLDKRIDGLNDSKQLSESKREELSDIIKKEALAYTLVHIPAEEIDNAGISACLKRAFTEAISIVDEMVSGVDLVLLDGNPLHLDEREVNVIKGDAKCPSISAASIVAKVERDHLMESFSSSFPQYGFDIHKGYGTKMHRDAIREFGLCELHRKSFCTEFTQQSLF